ncbi:MAG: M55 family metallopeptidase [Anaerolineae bacterium]|nr:M55 family metallopeptidase [Anaerolineae bacterium]
MKVFISADMEGISGVVAGQQTGPEGKEYERARKLMTAEVNAAVEGALAAGAEAIVVNDAHGSMRNILIEELNPAARLISGWPKPLSMMQGIDEGFDAAFFVGYHAQAGTAHSILDHTYAGIVYQVHLNGRPMGETGLNAALAGYFGVPVVLLTGDRLVVEEGRALLGPALQGVAVKESYGRVAAKCLPPSLAQERIRAAAQAALPTPVPPFRLEPPITLTVDFTSSAHADMAELIPGARREAGRRITYVHDDYLTLYKAWRAMLTLAHAS